MREQELENKAENDKRMPEANYACTLETCGVKRIKGDTCVDISTRRKLLPRDESINSTRLNEMINKEINDSIKRINNSIKDAMQTLVKCSMEEKKPILSHLNQPKGIFDVRILEECCKDLPKDYCANQQNTSHASQQCNNLSTCDNSYLYTKMHKSAIPLLVKNKNSKERMNKKHSKSANNAKTDNPRITGNVNIYICSEANNNNQGEKKSKHQLYMDTSSNTITNSRSTNVSTTLSCKLINSIKEKQKKLRVQQPPNFIHEKNSDDNTVRDNTTLRHRISRKELSEANGTEEADVKVNIGNIWRKDVTSSTKDCKDTDGTDLQQKSSYSTIPCSSFSTCNNTRHPQSRITLYPSEARARLNDDVFLPRTICTNVERRNYRKNNDRGNVCGDDREYTMCHAVDDNKWSKSIDINCVTYTEDPKERSAGNKNRNKIRQKSIINQNDIRKRRMGYKQQSLGSCQGEQVVRKWSTCSCIAEEEDYCKDIDRIQKEVSENVCNVIKCLEKISVCQTPSVKLAESATVHETFSASEKCSKKTQTCEYSVKHSKSMYERKFRNSEEPLKITKVSKEFVIEEPSKDITVRKTVFNKPSELAEKVMVYETAFPDSKDIPKETICKETFDSNLANQDDVNKLSLNDAKDKLVEGNTNSSNLNGSKENVGNKRMVKVNNKHDNDILNNFARQESVNVEQHKQKETLNDRTNFVSNSNVKKTSNILVNQQKIQSINRTMRNYSQRSNNLAQNLVSNKNNQLKEKTQENSKEEEEKQDISKEMGTTENKQKESFLYRFKKLIDVIKRRKTDRIKTGKIEARETITDGKNDNKKSEIISETKDKINNIKNQQEIIKKVATPMRALQTEIANEEIIKKIFARSKLTTPVTGFIILDKGKKMDVQGMNQTKPKLLRIIAAKRSHVLSTAMTTDSKPQEPEIVSVPAKIITIAHVKQQEIPEEEIILQEDTPAEIAEEIKADDSIAPERSVVAIETKIEDVPKDADEDRVPKGIQDEITKIHVTCPQKKTEEELQKPILCKCGLPSDPSSCLIVKCARDNVPCPQKKSEEEPQEFALCKCELASNSNNYPCFIVKCTKCNNIIEDCPCKDNGFERKKIYGARYRWPMMQCACAPYLKNCLKIDKPKFRDVSPLKISLHCKAREKCKYRKTADCCHFHEECRCRCAKHGDCSRINDKRERGSQASCINCGRLRNQCCCATFALIKCHKLKEDCDRKRTMICLYCDNPQDKCTCKAPIGKCSYCGLPSDVCNCQVDEGHAREYEQIARKPDENRTIRATSWKPTREIGQHFARNFEDFKSYSIEKCQCYEKPKRQRPEELPYQRLNAFSEVMNELQQKMSESVCCARCWRNPCCCESPVDQDKRKEERKAENRVKYVRTERLPRSKSPNKCRCNPKENPRNEHKSTIQKSIPTRHIGCICRLMPCRCRKNRFNCKRPLAKCYYCKSQPCTPNEARTRISHCCSFIAFFAAAALQ